jgi:Ca2+-dependent lipid-binding protein
VNESHTPTDPYVKANFDSFKKFKTPTIKNELSPAWDFDLFFYYETMYPRALSRKIFQLQVYDANSFRYFDGCLGVEVCVCA